MKALLGLLAVFAVTNISASNKTICGATDDRVYVSDNTKVLRISAKGKNMGCTATMISPSCAITAGHCKAALYKGEVNPPRSTRRGAQRSTKKELTYLVDQDSIKYLYDGWSDLNGKDWAVFKFKKNEKTGKLPGENGNFYQVDFNRPAQEGDDIRIYGFGIDRNDRNLNGVLQVHDSFITGLAENDLGELAILRHTIDTMGGNSGSSILRKSSEFPHEEKIIGIHTNGGCYSSGGANEGTAIYGKPDLIEAIKTCLAFE